MGVKVVHVINNDIGLRIHGRHYFQYLQQQGYDINVVCGLGSYVKGDMVTPDSIPVKAIPFPPRYTPVADLKTLQQLARHFRQQRYDIVHTHTVKPGLLGRIAARMVGVPIIIHTVHGFHNWDDMTRFEQWFFRQIERFAAHFCDLLLSQNREDIGVAIRDRICPSSKIHYLGNGIDIEFFHPDNVSDDQVTQLRQALGVLPGECLVGMIGRLVRLKGYYDYMAAARLLHEAGAPVKFLTIGFAVPDKRDALLPEALINQYNLSGVMTHLGPRQDVRELMAAMDTVVLASYAEGIPRVLMEAAAMGKAAVGTAVRGTKEVIVDKQTGVLVPPRQPGALADGIQYVLADKERAQAMGRAARQQAETCFDERFFFWRTDQEYRQLIRQKLSPNRLRTLQELPVEMSILEPV
ncbi:MAG: glycosyltransferase family 4 protein [Ardenticatenaceae bacterium]|nr:glycosyltransferase family 4 protein [Ardenticatenaceae bacterium]MCB9443937.1 glycosyltransferase family 4 protein [Ardenticatenaceae bacterium]